MNRFISFIVMLICAIECSMAQTSVSGHVVNKATEVPIVGANVIIKMVMEKLRALHQRILKEPLALMLLTPQNLPSM